MTPGRRSATSVREASDLFHTARESWEAEGPAVAGDVLQTLDGLTREPVTDRWLEADVLGLKLELLVSTGALSEAVDLCHEISRRYGRTGDPNLPYLATCALRVKVAVLISVGRLADAGAAGIDLAKYLLGCPTADRQREMGEQALEVGYALLGCRQDEAALTVCRAVAARFADQLWPTERRLQALAEVQALLANTHLGREAAARECQRALTGLGRAGTSAIDELVGRMSEPNSRTADAAAALRAKINLLAALGDDDGVAEAMAEFVDRFRWCEIPRVRALVSQLWLEL
jgi:hypothetical protein